MAALMTAMMAITASSAFAQVPVPGEGSRFCFNAFEAGALVGFKNCAAHNPLFTG